MTTTAAPFVIRLVKADGTEEIRIPQPGEVIPCEPRLTYWRNDRELVIIAPGAKRPFDEVAR